MGNKRLIMILHLFYLLLCMTAQHQAYKDVGCPRQESLKPVFCYYEESRPISQVNICNCTHVIFLKSVLIDENYKLQLSTNNLEYQFISPESPINFIFGAFAKSNVTSALIKSEKNKARFFASIPEILQKTNFTSIELNFDFDLNDSLSQENFTTFIKEVRAVLDHHRVKRDGYKVFESQKDDITTSKYTPAKVITKSKKIRNKKTRTPRSDQNVDFYDDTDVELGEEDFEDAEYNNNQRVKRDDHKKLLLLRLSYRPEVIAKKYNLKALSKYVDYFVASTHMMIDDSENHITFHHARLMGLSDMLNMDSVTDLLTGLGAPKSKLVVTIPTFALEFQLKNSKDTIVRSPTTGQPKIINRSELHSQMKNGEWIIERDEDLTAPYAFWKNSWIAFDDDLSLNIKGKYIILRELAGAAVYSIDFDDYPCFGGVDCDDETLLNVGGRFHNLLHKIFNNLGRKPRALVLESLQEEIHDSAIYSEEAGIKLSEYRIVRVVDHSGAVHVIRKNAKTEFECSRQGYFSHPLGCNKFYRCVKFNQYTDDFTVFEYDCPAGLAFDERWEVCVWPGALPNGAPCSGSSEIAPVPRSHYQCPNVEGYYADPENCRWFFACLDHARDGITPLTAYEFRCPFGLVFDEEKLTCEWPWVVGGCGLRGLSGIVINKVAGTRIYSSAAAAAASHVGTGQIKDGHAYGGATFASIPDYYVSGGRIEQKGGVILGEHLAKDLQPPYVGISGVATAERNHYGTSINFPAYQKFEVSGVASGVHNFEPGFAEISKVDAIPASIASLGLSVASPGEINLESEQRSAGYVYSKPEVQFNIPKNQQGYSYPKPDIQFKLPLNNAYLPPTPTANTQTATFQPIVVQDIQPKQLVFSTVKPNFNDDVIVQSVTPAPIAPIHYQKEVTGRPIVVQQPITQKVNLVGLSPPKETFVTPQLEILTEKPIVYQQQIITPKPQIYQNAYVAGKPEISEQRFIYKTQQQDVQFIVTPKPIAYQQKVPIASPKVVIQQPVAYQQKLVTPKNVYYQQEVIAPKLFKYEDQHSFVYEKKEQNVLAPVSPLVYQQDIVTSKPLVGLYQQENVTPKPIIYQKQEIVDISKVFTTTKAHQIKTPIISSSPAFYQQQQVISPKPQPIVYQQEIKTAKPVVQEIISISTPTPVLYQNERFAISKPLQQIKTPIISSSPVFYQQQQAISPKPSPQPIVYQQEIKTGKPIVQEIIGISTPTPVLYQNEKFTISKPLQQVKTPVIPPPIIYQQQQVISPKSSPPPQPIVYQQEIKLSQPLAQEFVVSSPKPKVQLYQQQEISVAKPAVHQQYVYAPPVRAQLYSHQQKIVTQQPKKEIVQSPYIVQKTLEQPVFYKQELVVTPQQPAPVQLDISKTTATLRQDVVTPKPVIYEQNFSVRQKPQKIFYNQQFVTPQPVVIQSEISKSVVTEQEVITQKPILYQQEIKPTVAYQELSQPVFYKQQTTDTSKLTIKTRPVQNQQKIVTPIEYYQQEIPTRTIFYSQKIPLVRKETTTTPRSYFLEVFTQKTPFNSIEEFNYNRPSTLQGPERVRSGGKKTKISSVVYSEVFDSGAPDNNNYYPLPPSTKSQYVNFNEISSSSSTTTPSAPPNYNVNVEVQPFSEEYLVDTLITTEKSPKKGYLPPPPSAPKNLRKGKGKTTIVSIGQIDKDKIDDTKLDKIFDKFSGKSGPLSEDDKQKFVTKVIKGEDKGTIQVDGVSTVGYEITTRGKSRNRGRFSTSTSSTITTTDDKSLAEDTDTGDLSLATLDLKNLKIKKNKKTVIVVSQFSDANPVLIGKLAGQCSCQSNSVDLRTKNRRPPPSSTTPANADDSHDGDGGDDGDDDNDDDSNGNNDSNLNKPYDKPINRRRGKSRFNAKPKYKEQQQPQVIINGVESQPEDVNVYATGDVNNNDDADGDKTRGNGPTNAEDDILGYNDNLPSKDGKEPSHVIIKDSDDESYGRPRYQIDSNAPFELNVGIVNRKSPVAADISSTTILPPTDVVKVRSRSKILVPVVPSSSEKRLPSKPQGRRIPSSSYSKEQNGATIVVKGESSPLLTPVPAEAIAKPGAAFDRYGPGGWRSADETLQGSVDCKRPGLFRHPKYCNKFYSCNYDPWKKRYTLHVFNCPVHLAYDSNLGACNWPSKGPACADDNLLV